MAKEVGPGCTILISTIPSVLTPFLKSFFEQSPFQLRFALSNQGDDNQEFNLLVSILFPRTLRPYNDL